MTKKEEKRIKSIAGRELKSFSPVTPFLTMPFHRTSAPAVFHLLKNILTEFFFLQQKEKYGFAHIPLLFADNPLDDKIPFTPEKVDIYMDFVPFFLRPLTMLIKRYGVRKAMPLCAGFARFIGDLYKQAGTVYRVCMTTTHRPDYRKNFKFRMIHRHDPHFLCVPSLHVCIAVGCYTYFKNIFDKENFPAEEKNLRLNELYKGAVAIIESVLYVKQHSVNCIPAALYMMTINGRNGLFTTDDYVKFINDLFVHSPEIPESDRKEIIEYIHFIYERMLLEGASCEDWREPIFHWFRTYAKDTGQLQEQG